MGNQPTRTVPPPVALQTPDAGRYIGLTAAYLKKARRFGTGPRFIRVGRTCLYRIADLDAFLDAHLVGGAS
jgi:hypothetical protein